MTRKLHRHLWWLSAAGIAAIAVSCANGPESSSTQAAVTDDDPPTAKGQPPLVPPPQDPGPPLVAPPVRQPPKMKGTGESIEAFVAWAVASTGAERELGRAVIVEASAEPKNVSLLGEQLMAWYQADVSRALVILAILGEMRTPDAEKQLTSFMALQAKPSGVLVEGADAAVTALGMLQAKAVDGLAYQGSKSADKQVLTIAAQHPDLAVRSEAMVAYLYSHGNTEAARKAVLTAVRPDEARYVDRVVKLPSDDINTFDQKVAAYLAAHPEAIPPKPVPAQPGAQP